MAEVYRDVHHVPCIRTERGTWANHHYTADGLIGERVTPETASHFITHLCAVNTIDDWESRAR
jgi:hypothetical protein